MDLKELAVLVGAMSPSQEPHIQHVHWLALEKLEEMAPQLAREVLQLEWVNAKQAGEIARLRSLLLARQAREGAQ